jgi:hypothetical protein
MPKDKKPRRRRSSAPRSQPVEQESPIEPAVSLPPVAREPVSIQRLPTASAPLLRQVTNAVRAVASAMIDIADATAEALTKQLERRA